MCKYSEKQFQLNKIDEPQLYYDKVINRCSHENSCNEPTLHSVIPAFSLSRFTSDTSASINIQADSLNLAELEKLLFYFTIQT